MLDFLILIKKYFDTYRNIKIFFSFVNKWKIAVNIVFKALNDTTRREILVLLRDGDKSAGEIAEYFKIGKATISHHLDLLKQADLVTATKQGQFVIYSLNTTVIDEILAWFLNFKKE